VLPWLLVDERAAGKQQMRLAANFLPNIHRGAGNGLLVRQGLMHQQPQTPKAL
jgi:hypothetical protein